MANIEFFHEFTEDNLKLQGVHWNVSNKNICVVCIHGMTGNIIDNYFGEVLGNKLSNQGYGFLFGHNRGYSHISDFTKKDGSYARIGAAYEIFEECIYDIDLWVNKALALGYKKIILFGHSIGANKVIYYLSNKNVEQIKSVILASPSDIIGDNKLEKDYNNLLEEAENNIKKGYPDKLLSSLLDNWFIVSSKTFLDSCIEEGPSDNLPFLRNPKKYEQLSKIKIPILAFYGSKEDNSESHIEDRLNKIKEKAINCPKYESKIIDGANHTYDDKELLLSDLIINYIKEYE